MRIMAHNARAARAILSERFAGHSVERARLYVSFDSFIEAPGLKHLGARGQQACRS